MDKMEDSGSFDVGSIPAGDAIFIEQPTRACISTEACGPLENDLVCAGEIARRIISITAFTFQQHQ